MSGAGHVALLGSTHLVFDINANPVDRLARLGEHATEACSAKGCDATSITAVATETSLRQFGEVLEIANWIMQGCSRGSWPAISIGKVIVTRSGVS